MKLRGNQALLASFVLLALALVAALSLSVRLYYAERAIDAGAPIVARYNEICRSIGDLFHLAANDAARAEQGHLDQIAISRAVSYDYHVLQGCALRPPISTNALDECWASNDLPCLARELDEIAKQLPSWRDQ